MSITRNGLTISNALLEAAAIAPIERAVLYAYEVNHPLFDEPIRFVSDTEDLVAGLEAGAPVDAGQQVTFLACPVTLQRPEESDGAANPSMALGRPGVSGIMKSALDRTRDSLEPITIIERVYVSDDPFEPAQLPVLQLEVDSTELTLQGASMIASYHDHANTAVPRVTFNRLEYPGLTR